VLSPHQGDIDALTATFNFLLAELGLEAESEIAAGAAGMWARIRTANFKR